MKPPQLNQVAIWLPMKNDALDVKTYDSYQYMDKGLIHSASSLKPVVRYAKNYYTDDHKFSLCLVSLEKDTEKMERFLDDVAKEIKPEDSMMRFTMTDHRYQP